MVLNFAVQSHRPGLPM